tara:strand:- start:45 stop:911 length:867 start_codon:yes stop_codon:yes gene_type:complete
MVSKMNKKKYVSINAEMLGRAYKIAKRAESSYQNGGIFIWSSGQGLNIVGTDRHSLIFFHDENGYLGDDFHHESLYFCASKFQKHKKFMQNLLYLKNHKKQVYIEDKTEDEGLIRSIFLKQKVDSLFNFKLKESNKKSKKNGSSFSVVCKSTDYKMISREILERNFIKIPKKKFEPTPFDLDKIKLIDNLVLRHGSKSRKLQPVTIHVAESNMLCAICEHAFLISMPLDLGDKTLKETFKSPQDKDKNIFEIAISEKKYKQIFNDIIKFLPDAGFQNNKKVYTQREEI